MKHEVTIAIEVIKAVKSISDALFVATENIHKSQMETENIHKSQMEKEKSEEEKSNRIKKIESLLVSLEEKLKP